MAGFHASDAHGLVLGHRKEDPIGTVLPQKGILTKQGTYIMAILGTCLLSNYHMSMDVAITLNYLLESRGEIENRYELNSLKGVI